MGSWNSVIQEKILISSTLPPPPQFVLSTLTETVASQITRQVHKLLLLLHLWSLYPHTSSCFSFIYTHVFCVVADNHHPISTAPSFLPPAPSVDLPVTMAKRSLGWVWMYSTWRTNVKKPPRRVKIINFSSKSVTVINHVEEIHNCKEVLCCSFISA